MQFRILGSLEAVADGGVAELGPPKQRALLAILVLHAGEIVSTDRLIDLIWPDQAPRTAAHSLQIYVSELRKALEPLGGGHLIVTRPPGYRLEAPPGSIDAGEFERLAQEAEHALDAGEPDRADGLLRSALALWRGPVLSDFVYEEFAQPWIARLDERHLEALIQLAGLHLDRGRTSDALALLDTATREDPLSERASELTMRALYRAGRPAEALRAYERLKSILDDELGLEPSPELQRLHERILMHDPALPGPTAAPAPSPVERDTPGLPPAEPATPGSPGDERPIAAAWAGGAGRGGASWWVVRLGGILLVAAAAAAVAIGTVGTDHVPRVALLHPGESDADALAENGFDRGVSDFGLVGREEFYDGRFGARALERLSDEGVGLIVVNGGLLDEDWPEVIAAHPRTRYVLSFPYEAPNVSCLFMAEQEASYLAGAAAALSTHTGTIGFVGGLDDWFIWTFHAGYEAGAHSVDPDIRIITSYLATGADFEAAFLAPEAAREAARAMYRDGADVVFHAAGESGIGVFQAATELSEPGRHLWAIGVDTDQYRTVAGTAGVLDAEAYQAHILTSVVKRIDRAIYAVLEEYDRGEFVPGSRVFGLGPGSVDIAYSGGYLDVMRPRLEALRAAIVAGEVAVPCVPRDRREAARERGIDPDACPATAFAGIEAP